MKVYDVVKYWNERENPCSTVIEKITNPHLNYLKKQIVGCKNILDFGPGYGRLFEAYEGIDEVVGVDVTGQHEKKLKEAAKKYGFDFNLIIRTDNFSKIEYPNKYFDAVVVVEVLFHQPPDVIEFVMKELNRISQKVVVVTGMNLSKKFDELGKYIPSDQYCFTYDYYKICKKNKWNIRNEERIKTQLMFVYSDYFQFNYNNKIIKFLFDRDDFYMSTLIKKTKSFYELKYLEFLKNTGILNNRSRVADIGAYLGNHSIYFSKIIGCSEVHCFEPTPFSYSVLVDNLIINEAKNVTCYPIAISSKSGKMILENSKSNNPGANQYKYNIDGVGCETLDSIIDQQIDFIKIDVERMEIEVLKGCVESIKKHRPIIMVEVDKHNVSDMTKWIVKNKYKRIGKEVFNKNTWLLKG